MPRATTNKGPELSEEQIERLRNVAQEDGGGVLYVVIKKLNEQGQEYPFGTRCYLSMEQVENERHAISSELGGGGDYLWRIYPTDQKLRKTPIEMFKITVTGSPPLDINEVERRMRAKEVQAGTMGTASWSSGVNNGWQNHVAPVTRQQQQINSEEAVEARELRRRLEEMREQARTAEHKREIDAVRSQQERELASLNTKFERMMEEMKRQSEQPKTDTIAESLKAAAPLILGYMQSQQAARDEQFKLLTATMQKSPLTELQPLLEQQSRVAEAARQEAQNTQKLLFDSLKRDDSDSSVKVFAAMAQQQQAYSGMISALLAQVHEMSQGDRESPLTEGLRNLIDGATGMVGTLVAQQPGGHAPAMGAPQLGGPPAPPPVPPAQAMQPARQQQPTQAMIRKQVLDLVDAKEEPITIAAAVIQYAEWVQRHNPGDPDISEFWNDHEAGTRRILAGHIAQMGGEGQKYLQEILEALPDAFEELARERAGETDEEDSDEEN